MTVLDLPSNGRTARKKPPTEQKHCGTRTGTLEHAEAGEETCARCRAADAEYMRKRRQATKARITELEAEVEELRHQLTQAGQVTKKAPPRVQRSRVTLPAGVFADLYWSATQETVSELDRILGRDRVDELIRIADQRRRSG